MAPTLGAADVVNQVKVLTQKAQALQGVANSINLLSGPLLMVGQGPFPVVISGLTDIVTTTNYSIMNLQESSKLQTTDDDDKVINAFHDYVEVQQAFLNILIGKAGLFTNTGVILAPVAGVLRAAESSYDTLVFGLVDRLHTKGSDLKSLGDKLTPNLTTAIEKYEGAF